MEITRDLFPTDARNPYLTLTLTSRDVESHNLLTALGPAERDRISEALTAAGATILRVLRGLPAEHASGQDKTNFGCGT